MAVRAGRAGKQKGFFNKEMKYEFAIQRKEDIRLLLMDFQGLSTEHIADKLKKGGFRGRLTNPAKCPLALFLGSYGYQVQVLKYAIRISEDVCVYMHRSLLEFIRDFDNGLFPTLIDYS